MAHKPPLEVTRRSFLIASCGLLVPTTGWSSVSPEPVLHWPLEGLAAPGRETVTGSTATLVDATGRLEWVNDSTTQLPRLDGYSVWLEHHLKQPVMLDRALALSAWVALESFPVATASVIGWGDATSGASLAVDRLGILVFTVRNGPNQEECRSEKPLDRNRWIHLACTSLPDGKFALFIDGDQVAISQPAANPPQLSQIQHIYLGRVMKDEIVAKVFPTNVLNGFVRQVRVYSAHLSPQEVKSLSNEFHRQTASLTADPLWFVTDAQRPKYHAMPPRAWTNEPHGLVHFRGQYHLFYQKNPNGPYWGHIHWGHMTSPDLLEWTEQPIALTPEHGPDSEGCWSGSAIVANGKIVILYTGGDGRLASICMASSEDGLHFTKHPGNPVLEAPPSTIAVKEFRDPFVWQEGAEYRMIIGSGITDVGGTALLYRSSDLIAWHYIKPILIGDKADSGVFWEMPVFIKIGEYRALIVCEVPGRASYWVGKWEDDVFTPLQNAPQRLDLFNHFLSPTPYIDEHGRAITIGITPETRSSLEQWQAGWAHLYGLPRELTLDAEHRLHQTPIKELATRFVPLLSTTEKQSLSTNWRTFEAAGTCLFLKARFERGSSETIVLALRRSPDRQEETLIRYDWQHAQLTLDRSKASMNMHTARDVKQVSYQPPTEGAIEFHVFLDESALEVFLDGQACFTSRIYPSLPESIGLAASSEGGEAYLTSLAISRWHKAES
jgi:sucrose-6-phosphate hydrolase SacC (GH32 family)